MALAYGPQTGSDIWPVECKLYGDVLNVKFNSLKSQLITFGGENPNQCSVL